MNLITHMLHLMNRPLVASFLLILPFLPASAQDEEEPKQTAAGKEEDYYRIYSLPVPEHVILEVGGLATMPDGGLAV